MVVGVGGQTENRRCHFMQVEGIVTLHRRLHRPMDIGIRAYGYYGMSATKTTRRQTRMLHGLALWLSWTIGV